MADARGATPSQLALAWILNKHSLVLPIPGTRRIANLESNVQAANIVLTTDEITALDRLFDSSAIAGARYPDAGMAGIEEKV